MKALVSTEFETIDVWIGEFPSRERLDAYFREVFDDDDDDVSISGFAEAMRQPYYDHDFIEQRFHESLETVDRLLQDHSYSRSYIAEVARVAAEIGVTSGNTTVVAWGRRISNPVSVVETDYYLKYIGRFACNPSLGT